MKRFWFVVSLVLLFIFTASASYIYFALAGGQPELDEPYRAAGTLATNLEAEVKTVEPEAALTISELYTLCGHTQELELTVAGTEWAGKSFDELASQGWAVAQTGEHSLAINRQVNGLCPQEAGQRVLQRTERGLAVYEGTAQYLGRLLLEMPLNFDEMPPDFLDSLESGGYQVKSQAELDELLETLDELITE